jgi:GntP family gluconate:H+ symporter
MEIPLRETNPAVLAELEAVSRRDDRQLPPLWLSLLPIALPVFLISGNAFLNSALSAIPKTELAAWQSTLLSVGKVAGDSNIALTISCAIGLATLAWQKKENLAKLSKGVQSALEDAGLIILITAAGGAFGGVLQQTGVGPRIQDLAAAYHIPVLPLAFAVTALVRIAQGSATVAMITAVGMFAGVATPAALGFHPLSLALAIGCGSKPIPWMIDSGFWVVCKMSGMTEKETLKTHSVMATTMGFVGIIATMISARIFPMV